MPPRPSRRVGRGEGMPPAPDLGLPALAPRENTEASPTLVPLPSPGTPEDTNPTPSPATPESPTADDGRRHAPPLRACGPDQPRHRHQHTLAGFNAPQVCRSGARWMCHDGLPDRLPGAVTYPAIWGTLICGASFLTLVLSPCTFRHPQTGQPRAESRSGTWSRTVPPADSHAIRLRRPRRGRRGVNRGFGAPLLSRVDPSTKE